MSVRSHSPGAQTLMKLMEQTSEQYPEFVHLLIELGQYINDDNVSKDLVKDRKQAEEALRLDKQNWIHAHILYHEVQEIIHDYNIRSQNGSLSLADQEFKEILEQSLSYVETSSYLSITSDLISEVSLLGIQPIDIESSNPYRKHIPSLQQKLIPEFEDRLRCKCENLVSVFHTSTLTDSSTLALAKSSQLPAMVERLIRVIDDEKQQVKVAQERREKQFWTYFQTLLESLGVLEKMIKDYRLEKQVRHSSITTDSLLARCDAMCLKIKSVELQILCETYTVETVAALTRIRQELVDTTEMKQRDLQRTQSALQAYASVGYGFEQLAEEYSNLMRDLENKQWALGELGKSE